MDLLSAIALIWKVRRKTEFRCRFVCEKANPEMATGSFSAASDQSSRSYFSTHTPSALFDTSFSSSSSSVPGVGIGSMTFLSSGFASPVTGRVVQHDRKFTASILRHGLYQDNTLTAATKSKERHLQQLKRNQQSMDRLVKKFNREAKHVIKLQKQLAQRQQEMVYTAQQKFAVPYLQAIVRGYLARRKCAQLRSVRLIGDYYKFRLHFRRFVSKLQIIQRSVIIFLVSKKMAKYARRLRAVTRLQHWYHHHWLLRRAILKRITLNLWNHYRLFGITRAIKKIVPIERHRYVLNRFMKSFIWKSRLRRLLNPLMMRQIFFSLFQSDVYSERKNAERFFLPSTPNPSIFLAKKLNRYSLYNHLFRTLQLRELRLSTLQTLQYVLRAQHFKFFPFTQHPCSSPPTLNIENLSELNYMKRLLMEDHELSPPLSEDTLAAFKKVHLRTLRRSSYSQLETEPLFYLEVIPTSEKYCPFILRDVFRLRSIEDILVFLQALSSVLRQNPLLLSTDLQFPQTENSSIQSIYEFSVNPNSSSILKRKRVFNFPTTTMRPFGAAVIAIDTNTKKVRYQRRGGALLNIGGNTPPKLKAKKEEVKTKAEKLREQKALLAMAAMEARQAQKKLDLQSGNIADAGNTEESGTVNENLLISLPFSTPESIVPISLPTHPIGEPSITLLTEPAFAPENSISTLVVEEEKFVGELSYTPGPELPSTDAAQELSSKLLLEEVQLTHLNLSLSSGLLLSPAPALPSQSSRDEEDVSAVYDDDFEPESRGSSRSSRRGITPRQSVTSSSMFPPIPTSSRPSSSAMDRLRSPSRPEGPAPSRRSFRETLSRERKSEFSELASEMYLI